MVPGPTAPGMGPVGDYGLLQRQVVKQEPGMVPVAPGPGIGYTLGGIPMAPQVGATSPVPSDGGSSSAGSLNASLSADQVSLIFSLFDNFGYISVSISG